MSAQKVGEKELQAAIDHKACLPGDLDALDLRESRARNVLLERVREAAERTHKLHSFLSPRCTICAALAALDAASQEKHGE
jgi:hypothetical protein